MYAIYAYSPTLNQRVRKFDLANQQLQTNLYDQRKANLDAENFAQLQNQLQYLKATDWQGVVEYLAETGIETYVQAQNALGQYTPNVIPNTHNIK
jgi:hypothetical protein